MQLWFSSDFYNLFLCSLYFFCKSRWMLEITEKTSHSNLWYLKGVICSKSPQQLPSERLFKNNFIYSWFSGTNTVLEDSKEVSRPTGFTLLGYFENSQDRGATMAGYRLFRRGRPEWQGLSSFIWQSSRNAWSSAWRQLRTHGWLKGQTNMGDIGVGVCHKMPIWGCLQTISRSLTFVGPCPLVRFESSWYLLEEWQSRVQAIQEVSAMTASWHRSPGSWKL